METFAPEFSRFWLPGNDGDVERRQDARDDEIRREKQALEELAERVSAARSIV
jgi:hypothetical protein